MLTAPGSVAIDGANLEPADVADNGDFSISDDGVLTFNIPPDFESPDDEGGDNVYNIVLAASDDEPGAGGMVGHRKVTITVEDVIEMGRVTLSSLQPQVTDVLTATFTDLDRASAAQPAVADVAWKWEKSQSRTSGWTAISGGTLISITPDATTTGYYLRATATYDDLDGDETTAPAVSANRVRVAPTSADDNAVFPNSAGTRSVDENSPAGTAVGNPVAATDTADDVLTYSLTTNPGSFEIDPATGQITVGSRTILNHETAGLLQRRCDGH